MKKQKDAAHNVIVAQPVSTKNVKEKDPLMPRPLSGAMPAYLICCIFSVKVCTVCCCCQCCCNDNKSSTAKVNSFDNFIRNK